ncbi:MAG: hypothetical protein KC457_11235 [Myxococcales bacterium]|nr:hypothetical protein [Myxococcales bacterium]
MELEDEAPADLEDDLADEKREALAVLQGILTGEAMPEETIAALEEADPTLVYFILKYVKKHYHRDHDDYELMKSRLSEIKNTARSLTRRAKDGEGDPVVEWFESNHRYSDLSPELFIDLIVDKLEG